MIFQFPLGEKAFKKSASRLLNISFEAYFSERETAATQRKTGVLRKRRWRLNTSPLLAAAVGTEDVSSFGYETFVGQVEGASFTVEAVFVPGASLVIHHIYAFTKTCDQRQEG